MAENEKQGTNDDESVADFNEELELDLFDNGLEPDADDAKSEFGDADSDNLETIFQGELSDDLDDDFHDALEREIIDPGNDDPGQEFVAPIREEARAEDSDPISDSDPAPTLQSTGPSNSLTDEDSDADGLFLNMINEEFGAPDQYSWEYGVNARAETRKAGKASGKPTSTPNTAGLATVLAALSPRMIAATTFAVLLPVFLFITLGFSSDQSTANESTGVATFVDQSNNNSPDTESAADTPPPRINAREPDRIQVPELAAAVSPESNTALQSTADEPTASAITNQSQATKAEPSTNSDLLDEPDPRLMLAQADTGRTDSDQASDDAPTNTVQERSTEPASQAANGQAAMLETELSEPAAATDPPRQPAIAEASSNENTAEVGVISAAESTGRNYHVVVASFAAEDQARQHAAGVSDEEITAYLIPPFGGADNYRVAVAGYSSMAEARENIPGLQAVYGSGIWPLRYPPAPPLQIINEQAGNTYIIVASFQSAELAQTHANGLITDGEQPVIIAPYPPANRYRVAVSSFESLTNAQNALPRYRQNYGEDAWLLRY